jgi:hypothetical protein
MARLAVFSLFIAFLAAVFPAITSASSNEGVYLALCIQTNYYYSIMAYYRNAKTGSQHGEKPDDFVIIAQGAITTWEGTEVCGYFADSGETFCSEIKSDANSFVRLHILYIFSLFLDRFIAWNVGIFETQYNKAA